MYDLVITNATIVAADLQYKGSICIKDGKIAAIATDAPEVVDAAQTIDAQGLLAFPGLIDVHAHLGERGEGDTESVTCSSKAAAVGGITTCVDMPTNQPVIKNAEILREKIRYMRDECRIDHILLRRAHPRQPGRPEGDGRAGRHLFQSLPFLFRGGIHIAQHV